MGQYQHVEGHLVGLLQIVVAANVDLSIRQVASIYLKNVSARDWMPREPGKEFYLGGPFFSCGFGGFMLSLFYAGIWQEYQNLNKSSCFGGIFFLNGWASLSISYVPMSLLSLDLHVCTQQMWLTVMLVPGDRSISESDKATVRENLLEAIIQAPPIIRCIFGSSTSSLAFWSLPSFVSSTILWAYSCDSWLKF